MLHGRLEGDPRHGALLRPLLPGIHAEGQKAIDNIKKNIYKNVGGKAAAPLAPCLLQEGRSGSGDQQPQVQVPVCLPELLTQMGEFCQLSM